MRDLFQLDRAVAPATVRTGMMIVGGMFSLCAGLIIVLALAAMLGFNPIGTVGSFLTGLLQISLGVGCLLALYMILRLLGEILMALHRLNDRMGILSDEMKSTRATQKAAGKPAARKTSK